MEEDLIVVSISYVGCSNACVGVLPAYNNYYIVGFRGRRKCLSCSSSHRDSNSAAESTLAVHGDEHGVHKASARTCPCRAPMKYADRASAAASRLAMNEDGIVGRGGPSPAVDGGFRGVMGGGLFAGDSAP